MSNPVSVTNILPGVLAKIGVTIAEAWVSPDGQTMSVTLSDGRAVPLTAVALSRMRQRLPRRNPNLARRYA